LLFLHGLLSVIEYLNIDNTGKNYFTRKYQTMLHVLCSCSYLFTFLLSSQFSLTYPHKINSLLFEPQCICNADSDQNSCKRRVVDNVLSYWLNALNSFHTVFRLLYSNKIWWWWYSYYSGYMHHFILLNCICICFEMRSAISLLNDWLTDWLTVLGKLLFKSNCLQLLVTDVKK